MMTSVVSSPLMDRFPIEEVGFSLEDNGVRIDWPNGQQSFFHHVWLRDCCYCETCGDTYSSKRYLKPSDVPLDVAPQKVQLIENDIVSINCDPMDINRDTNSSGCVLTATRRRPAANDFIARHAGMPASYRTYQRCNLPK